MAPGSGRSARLARLLVAVVVVIAAFVLATGPAVAAETTTSFVSLDVNRGGNFSWYPAAGGSVTVEGDPSQTVSVSMAGGPSGGSGWLEFQPRRGDTLTPGTYENAVMTDNTTPVNPGLDASLGETGCGTIGGRFTILDIAPDLSRFWATYEVTCDGTPWFGEVRLNEPGGDPDLLVVSDHVDWPQTYPGASAHPVPVTLVNTGVSPVTISGATVTSGASSFSVARNTCTSLSPGDSCVVYVAFVPAATGVLDGILTISDSTPSGSHTVVLRGRGEEGYTSLKVTGAQGDPITQGQTFSYDPRNATVEAGGDETTFDMEVRTENQDWGATFQADRGHLLLPGLTFTGATRHPFNEQTEPGLTVDGNGSECNQSIGSFTVREATYGQSGRLVQFAATFEQRCLGEPPLTGSVAWRATDPAAAPPPLPRASTLTLTPRSSRIVGGRSITLAGVLRAGSAGSGVVGKRVTLVSSPNGKGRWLTVTHASTGQGGRYHFALRPRLSSYYRVDFAGNENYTGATSAASRVVVGQAVSLHAAHIGGRRREPWRLTVHATPYGQGDLATLQRLVAGHWQRSRIGNLGRQGYGSFTLPAATRGTFRVVAMATQGVADSASAAVHLR